MGRFAYIGNKYLNTDHIISTSEEAADDTIDSELSDGQTITRPSSCLSELLGENMIRQLVAIEGCCALFERKGSESEQIPVRCFAVTEAGTARPMDMGCDYCDFMDSASNFEGLL